jgi:hypothetical protein
MNVGMVQTADTGQINWLTVTVPTVINERKGYEIWRFNDALQATAPVFLKISYGSANAAASYPGIWITIGTGSDGAGNLTGIVLAETQTGPVASNASSWPMYASGSTNRFALLCWPPSSPSYSILFSLSLERLHDVNGVDTGAGLMMFQMASSQTYHWYIPFSGLGKAWIGSKWDATVPTLTGAQAPYANAYPVRTWQPQESCPSQNWLTYFPGDFATAATYDVACWDGVTRRFLTMPYLHGGFPSVSYGGNGYPMMRWE